MESPNQPMGEIKYIAKMPEAGPANDPDFLAWEEISGYFENETQRIGDTFTRTIFFKNTPESTATLADFKHETVARNKMRTAAAACFENNPLGNDWKVEVVGHYSSPAPDAKLQKVELSVFGGISPISGEVPMAHAEAGVSFDESGFPRQFDITYKPGPKVFTDQAMLRNLVDLTENFLHANPPQAQAQPVK